MSRGTVTTGPRVILTIYLVVVAIAGLTGFVIGAIGPAALRPPRLFFLVELEPSPVGMALYGAVTLASLLGVLLLLVVVVSRRYVDPVAENGDPAREQG